METEPRRGLQFCAARVFTVAFVKPNRGAWPYHEINSSNWPEYRQPAGLSGGHDIKPTHSVEGHLQSLLSG